VEPKDKYDDKVQERFILSLAIPQGKGKDAIWEEIFEKLERTASNPYARFWEVTRKIAAMFIGLMVIGSILWIFLFGSVKHYAPYGHHMVVMLPDSSKVKLNADSELKYNKVLWAISRKVSLKGEALFEVRRGKDFKVKTGSVATRVLGTTFNIYARNQSVLVSCIEGKVQVKHTKSKQAYILYPEQKIASKKGSLTTPEPAAKPKIASWINGEFLFTNETLENVFNEVERQYNIKIRLNTSGQRLYSGAFKNSNLDEALELICLPMNLTWKKENGYIVINEKQE
jgi:ferric-dicitrate binding protein FerR (iron transport regulator)